MAMINRIEGIKTKLSWLETLKAPQYHQLQELLGWVNCTGVSTIQKRNTHLIANRRVGKKVLEWGELG
jgi:hypothetical protein